MSKSYNPNLVQQYRSYTVNQICALYKNRKLHPQTVREWVNSGALEAVSKKPILVNGMVLKEFFRKKNIKSKKHLKFNQVKCVKCGQIASPKDNEVSLYRNKNGSLKAVGICDACNSRIIRFYKKTEQAEVEKIFLIKKAGVLTLCNPSSTASRTNLDNKENNAPSESLKRQKDGFCGENLKADVIYKQTSLFDLP